jgi:hypothetical protein
MKKQTLLYTNPHLRDQKKCRKGLVDNVLTSTAVEIGRIPKALRKKLEGYDFESFPLVNFKPTTLFS